MFSAELLKFKQVLALIAVNNQELMRLYSMRLYIHIKVL